MTEVITVEPATTDCHVSTHAGALQLTAPELNSGAVTTVMFGRETGGRLPVRIGSTDYRLTDIATAVVPGPPAHPSFGVTTIAAVFDGPTGSGTMAIVVNCGQEPPMLSIAATHRGAAERRWEWPIDHAIQHQVLTHLRVPGQC